MPSEAQRTFQRTTTLLRNNSGGIVAGGNRTTTVTLSRKIPRNSKKDVNFKLIKAQKDCYHIGSSLLFLRNWRSYYE